MHICRPNQNKNKKTKHPATTPQMSDAFFSCGDPVVAFFLGGDLAGICAWSIHIMFGFVSFLGFPQCLPFSHAVSYAGASAEFGQAVIQPFSQPVTGLTVYRHSQTEAERETETDTETDTGTDRHTDKQTGRQAGRQADREGGR